MMPYNDAFHRKKDFIIKKKTVEIAKSLEATTRHMKELHTSSKSVASIEVNKVMSGQFPPQMVCYVGTQAFHVLFQRYNLPFFVKRLVISSQFAYLEKMACPVSKGMVSVGVLIWLRNKTAAPLHP